MKGVKHYLVSGTEHKGATHKHKDGTLMTGAKMPASSKRLVHRKDLSKAAKTKTNAVRKK